LTNPTKPSAARAKVQARGDALRHKTDSVHGGFDARSEIVPTSDGTLVTKKSLLAQSGKQVAKDAGVMFDSAKALAERLIDDKK
jgi:conjugal transfer mating pair stabilization protein TraG